MTFFTVSPLTAEVYYPTLETNKQSCEKGNMKSCSSVADHYLSEKDYAKALAYNNKSCNGNFMHGCAMLAHMYIWGLGVQKNDVMATKLYIRACDEGGIVCGGAASAYSSGKGVKKDYEQAIEYYYRDCSSGKQYACYRIAFIYETATGSVQNFDKALEFYGKMCSSKDEKSCGEIKKHPGGATCEAACGKFKKLYDKVCLTDPKKYCSKYE